MWIVAVGERKRVLLQRAIQKQQPTTPLMLGKVCPTADASSMTFANISRRTFGGGGMACHVSMTLRSRRASISSARASLVPLVLRRAMVSSRALSTTTCDEEGRGDAVDMRKA